MSWSLSASGKGQPLIDELTTSFERNAGYCSNMPAEQECVIAAGKLVIDMLKACPNVAFRVSANGYMSKTGEDVTSATVDIKMETLHNFKA